jgi:4-hydroxy 2-oxovalerate aldolase
MVTIRYTEQELNQVIDTANRIGAYACYFVDSYGYMTTKDVQHYFDYFDSRLNKDIKIGFHAHNNLNLAFANVQYFANIDTERELIIDSCATGMGQGAGNMQTELLMPYLNEHFGGSYKYQEVLDICDFIDQELNIANLWGYSVTCLLPALHKTAYKLAIVMRTKYHMSYRDIDLVLRDMPAQYRFRFTYQDLDDILVKLNKMPK